MDSASSEPTLLYGIVAVQMDFITRDELSAALTAWTQEMAKPLGQLLEEKGALSSARRQLLEALVKEHLKQHGDDPVQSLRALGCSPSLKEMLQRIDDPDLQESLTHALTEGWDEYATRATDSSALIENEEFPTASEPPAGAQVTTVSRFQVVRLHARGGLGEVFVAHDDELNRNVALKRIQIRHADQEQSRSRFLREAEITAGLEHPGIVPVYGLGHYASGHPFYSMRFIQGESLKEAIERFHGEAAKLDVGERELLLRKLLKRFIDVCEALEYAHSRGVLHRDLKPSNVMLGRYGETLVVDWGLAKDTKASGRRSSSQTRPAEMGADEASASAGHLNQTLPGSAIGTPQYMSPEQAAGRLDQLGACSDIYGLGASLYHLLTGQPPFDDPELHVVLENVRLGKFPRPRQAKRTVPRALEEICMKAMAREPEARYGSAQELADDVERWLADEPVTAYQEPTWRRMRRWMGRHSMLVGTVAVIAFAVAASWFAYLVFESTVSNSRQALIEGTQESNRFAAQFVASSISWQINQRFDILEDVSRSERFRQLVAEAEGKKRDAPARQALQREFDRLRKENASLLGKGAEVWFVCDREGFQLARNPMPADGERDTIDDNFAFRDYFHNRGKDLSPGSDLRGVRPYKSREPYMASIYRDVANGKWFVPFSVPIWSSDQPDGKVIGVFTTSVRLGGFGELRTYSGPQFATLVNLRADDDGARGLIMQHPDLVGTNAEYFLDEKSKYMLEDLAQKMYKLQKEGRAPAEALSTTGYLDWSSDYQDPVGRVIPRFAGSWMAEAWPVFINLPNDERVNTGWMVIIQEPREGALAPIRTLRETLIQLGVLALGLVLLLVTGVYAAAAFLSRRAAPRRTSL